MSESKGLTVVIMGVPTEKAVDILIKHSPHHSIFAIDDSEFLELLKSKK